MTPEQKLRLFQPFSQGDSSVDREFGGTGLGLAISQRLAQMLHGEITIESERGRGSTFTLTIDVGKSINANALATKDLDAPAVPPKANKNIETRIEARILIVDDRRDIRFIAQQFIENAGGTVETGENGLDALNAVSVAEKAGSPFDLVVLDMQMPLMDGYEAARQLRKSGFDKPIVALTAHAMEGDRDACIDAGCTDYMPKPIDGKAFVDLVQSYVVDNT
jgi:two-component system CheB/CheR fusion protein